MGGLHRYKYPFDELRSPLDGVIRCLDTSFADFFESTRIREEEGGGRVFTGTTWEGSFGQVDPNDHQTRQEYGCRIERLLGARPSEVSAKTPRVFVRAVNSTDELHGATKLYEALCRMLPKATIYLLFLVDCQTYTGLVHFTDSTEHIIFYRIRDICLSSRRNLLSNDHKSDPYANAISCAIRFWESTTCDSDELVVEAASIDDAFWFFRTFSGGDPAKEGFYPVRDHACLKYRMTRQFHKTFHKPPVYARKSAGGAEQGDEDSAPGRCGCTSALARGPRNFTISTLRQAHAISPRWLKPLGCASKATCAQPDSRS